MPNSDDTGAGHLQHMAHATLFGDGTHGQGAFGTWHVLPSIDDWPETGRNQPIHVVLHGACSSPRGSDHAHAQPTPRMRG